MTSARPLKRRRLGTAASGSHSVDTLNDDDAHLLDSAFSRGASRWNLEQDYEKHVRSSKKEANNLRLPVKTREGRLEPAAIKDVPTDAVSGSSDESTEDENTTEDQPNTENEQQELWKILQVPKKQIMDAKEELSRIATSINEDPVEHIGLLKRLTEISARPNLTIQKLGLATQTAVYMDIIPDYRIRRLTEEEKKTRVSIEVRNHRTFEQSLAGGYENFVNNLSTLAMSSSHNSSDSKLGIAEVASSCACTLIEHVSHFNSRGLLLDILIWTLGQRGRKASFQRCLKAMVRLFENDEDGNAALEAVEKLSNMIKAKKFRIDEEVLNLFLHLRLLSEFSQKASDRVVDNPESTRSNLKPKQTQSYLTKKERKAKKERKKIEKEMREADAVVSHEDKDRNQGKMLKLVFGTYIRILKVRMPGLMGAVLEGLVKFSHLINQDFFGDVLESLRELLTEIGTGEGDYFVGDVAGHEATSSLDRQRDIAREVLLCVNTALSLLEGQDVSKSAQTLGLDLNFFISRLYRMIYDLSLDPNLEMSSKSSRLLDPDSNNDSASKPHVNVSTTVVLLVRALQAILLPQHTRSAPPLRLAAFSKQLMTAALQVPEKSCIAVIGLMNQTIKTHKTSVTPLWHTEERKGDGVFNPLVGELESSNPFATTIWEGELLRLHFCPTVKAATTELEALASSS